VVKIFKLAEQKGSYTPKATREEYGSNQYFEARNLTFFDVGNIVLPHRVTSMCAPLLNVLIPKFYFLFFTAFNFQLTHLLLIVPNSEKVGVF
jgi:hypothetical protein